MKLCLNKIIISNCVVLFISIFIVTAIRAETSYDRVNAIKKQIFERNDFEDFTSKHSPPRIKKVILADLYNSGHQQAIILLNPHFRQSPFILIYRLLNENRVVRVTEGLAPGELVPVSGKYLDSHALRVSSSDLQATDLHLGDKQHELQARTAFRDEALKKKVSVVEYPSFFHIDGRRGNGTYIDMTHIKKAPYDSSCANFEFSEVEDISVGHLDIDRNRNYLVASVKNNIYVYRIDEINEQGLLNKKLWVIPRPKEFRKFLQNRDGDIVYQNSMGHDVKFIFIAQ